MTEPIATIRSQDDLIEALRAAKEMRNLSDRILDELGDFTIGQVNKVLGPRREKGLSPFMLQMMCSLLAVKLELVPDPEQEARMRDRWEGRNLSNVRLEPSRISAKVIERVKPHVFREMQKLSTAAKLECLTAEHRTRIARKAAKSRWRKHRKTMRERLKERKAKSSTLRDIPPASHSADAAIAASPVQR